MRTSFFRWFICWILFYYSCLMDSCSCYISLLYFSSFYSYISLASYSYSWISFIWSTQLHLIFTASSSWSIQSSFSQSIMQYLVFSRLAAFIYSSRSLSRTLPSSSYSQMMSSLLFKLVIVYLHYFRWVSYYSLVCLVLVPSFLSLVMLSLSSQTRPFFSLSCSLEVARFMSMVYSFSFRRVSSRSWFIFIIYSYSFLVSNYSESLKFSSCLCLIRPNTSSSFLDSYALYYSFCLISYSMRTSVFLKYYWRQSSSFYKTSCFFYRATMACLSSLNTSYLVWISSYLLWMSLISYQFSIFTLLNLCQRPFEFRASSVLCFCKEATSYYFDYSCLASFFIYFCRFSLSASTLFYVSVFSLLSYSFILLCQSTVFFVFSCWSLAQFLYWVSLLMISYFSSILMPMACSFCLCSCSFCLCSCSFYLCCLMVFSYCNIFLYSSLMLLIVTYFQFIWKVLTAICYSFLRSSCCTFYNCLQSPFHLASFFLKASFSLDSLLILVWYSMLALLSSLLAYAILKDRPYFYTFRSDTIFSIDFMRPSLSSNLDTRSFRSVSIYCTLDFICFYLISS